MNYVHCKVIEVFNGVILHTSSFFSVDDFRRYPCKENRAGNLCVLF